MKRFLPVLLLLAALFALPGAQAADLSKLRVGVEGAYPPFSTVGPDGKLQGFDIDIANALCTEMKSRCTLVQQEFDGLIPSLQSRKVDMVVASMSITPERLKVVGFTDKYYNSANKLIAKTGSPIDGTPARFKGTRIGVQRTTINDRYVTAKFTEATIVRYASQDEVYLDLAAGRIDATMVDGIAGDIGFLKTPAGKGFGFVGPDYRDPEYFGSGAGIALRQGDTDLRDRLNAAIKAIRANGTYQKLAAKYFNYDIFGQ
jgi:arginine/ornithine transport system substrate-binding protein